VSQAYRHLLRPWPTQFLTWRESASGNCHLIWMRF